MEQIGLSILLNETEHAAPPGHPENPHRLSLVIEEFSRRPDLVRLESTPADLDVIHRLHDKSHTDSLTKLAGSGGGYADPDTYITSGSMKAARTVAGAVLNAVDRAFGDGPQVSFVLGRPPGHHAGTDFAMGFCLINNVAVAAQYAIDKYQADRVAIIDFDVHHGNGTQQIFYERNDVLYISTHQYPFYPGTGAKGETGTTDGKGYSLNFPLPAGTGNQHVLDIFGEEIIPALERYEPQLVLVSAGFDAHRLDPIGGFELTGEVYQQIARLLSALSREKCDGRIVAVLEGGYDPEGNLDSIDSFVKGLQQE